MVLAFDRSLPATVMAAPLVRVLLAERSAGIDGDPRRHAKLASRARVDQVAVRGDAAVAAAGADDLAQRQRAGGLDVDLATVALRPVGGAVDAARLGDAAEARLEARIAAFAGGWSALVDRCRHDEIAVGVHVQGSGLSDQAIHRFAAQGDGPAQVHREAGDDELTPVRLRLAARGSLQVEGCGGGHVAIGRQLDVRALRDAGAEDPGARLEGDVGGRGERDRACAVVHRIADVEVAGHGDVAPAQRDVADVRRGGGRGGLEQAFDDDASVVGREGDAARTGHDARDVASDAPHRDVAVGVDVDRPARRLEAARAVLGRLQFDGRGEDEDDPASAGHDARARRQFQAPRPEVERGGGGDVGNPGDATSGGSRGARTRLASLRRTGRRADLVDDGGAGQRRGPEEEGEEEEEGGSHGGSSKTARAHGSGPVPRGRCLGGTWGATIFFRRPARRPMGHACRRARP